MISPAVAAVAAVVAACVALIIARTIACAVALGRARRSLPVLAKSASHPAISVVIPLHGWDEHFLDLLDGLARAADSYGSAVELIVVVDDAHPRRAEIASRRLVRAIDPASVPLEPGDVDKMRRLRVGVRAARHPFVLLTDSDVVVDGADDTFLLRRMAAFASDPGLRLAFALPAYAQARRVGDVVLGAFTLHHNLFLYFLGLSLVQRGTSIGPSQLFRNDDGVLLPLLDDLRRSIGDDHGLGHRVELRGERVRALPFHVTVHMTDASVGKAIGQVTRWFLAARTVTGEIGFVTLVYSAFTLALTGAGNALLALSLASLASAQLDHALFARDIALPAAAGAVVVMFVDAVAYALLEARFFARSPKLSSLLAVPAFMLATPLVFARSLFVRRVSWRGIDVSTATAQQSSSQSAQSAQSAAAENGTRR